MAFYGNGHRVTQSAQDWYRRTTWSAEDEKDFFLHLKRARQKAQDLVLQASALIDTTDPGLAGAGLGLIDLMLRDHPEAFFLSNAYLTRAQGLVRLGRPEQAVPAFRDALSARRALPNVINDAYLKFAWTVARLGLQQYYDEACDVLQEFRQASELAFSANAYRYFGALAFILADHGDRLEARERGKAAVEAISTEYGPFSRHSDFGVMDRTRINVAAHRRLLALAAV